MPQQTNWRFCQNCQVLFFDGFPTKGVCPSGGGHLAEGINFDLSYGFPDSATAQANWRFCSKCNAMYFDGFADKGTCPAGGPHTPQGYNFTLPHDVAATATAQASWSYCNNCHSMFFNGYPTKGLCPAHMVPGPHGPVRGGHVAQGYNFVLPHDTPAAAAATASFSMTGPVWVVSLTHQQVQLITQVLGASSDAATNDTVAAVVEAILPESVVAAGPAAPIIAAAIEATAWFLAAMDFIGGNNGVDIQGVIGTQGVIVTPHLSGLFETLVATARQGVAAGTIVEFLLAASQSVPAVGESLGVQTAAAVFAKVTGGTPLGWALDAVPLGLVINLLEPTPDPNQHGGIHADRTTVGDWERFILTELPSGNHVALLSWQGLFSAQGGGGGEVYANRVQVGAWETWALIKNADGTVSFQSNDGHFLSALNGGGSGSYCTVTPKVIGNSERFFMQTFPGGHIALRTHDKNTYLSVQSGK